jgi:hypothetical protein
MVTYELVRLDVLTALHMKFYCLLGRDAVFGDAELLMFRKNLLPPSTNNGGSSSSEILVAFCQNARHHIPEGSNLQNVRTTNQRVGKEQSDFNVAAV